MILLDQITIWTKGVTRHIPSQNGQDLGGPSITDNVCVHGKDEEEHDQNLKALMDRAKETGLVFNSDKCTIRQPEISFFLSLIHI